MATTTASALNAPDANQRRFALVVAGDRTAEFRHARRRSIAVRMMRWLLPALGVAVLGGYAMTILKTAGIATSMPELSLRKILPQDLAMNNPRYEGFGKDGSSYTFTAKTARQDLTAMNLIELDQISGWVTQADKSRTEITATRGNFDHEASVLELFDSIDVVSESGLKAKLTRATILTKENLLKSSEPVEVEFPAGTINSNTMTLRQKAREISFIEKVQVALKPRASQDAAPKPKQNGNLFAQSDEPIDIAANRLDVNDTSKIAIFTGDVRAAQGDGTLTTPELEVGYEGSASNGANGTPQPADAEKTDAQKEPAKIRRLVAKEPVVMTRGETDVVSSNNAEFNVAQETAVLTGNVIMISGAERRVTSDRVDLDQHADTALLTGDVEVVQGKNELKGSRLFIDRKAGRTQLTSPAELGGNGRISAKLYQGAGKEQSAAKVAKGAGATAGGAEGSPFTFKTDPSAPVEVEADQLNVNDSAKVAVFEGNVNATQGDFTINSSELHAFYKGGSGLADITRSETGHPAQGKQEAGTELTRIEAKKNVVVTSKRGQTATGDWAEFDTKAKKVMLGGDVVVTQGQNMVRGTRLVIDMVSGESKIDTAPAKAVVQPAGGGWSTETPQAGTATPESPGRASAVFFPQQLKKGQSSKAAPDATATPGSATDGWAAHGDPATSPTPGN
jgi:lipopolysaccharide transport protein LptA/LPS export ABC transporter protein LptC